jgi:choline dehydrogenase-like flavoprotein
MKSGIGPEEVLRSAGLNVGVNLPGVGQNLGDHCFLRLEAVIDRNITNTEKRDRPIEPQDGSPLIAWLKLGEALRSDEYRALPLEIQNHVSKPRTPTSEFALVGNKFDPQTGRFILFYFSCLS